MSEWSTWEELGNCSKDCGTGYVNKTRSRIVDGQNPGDCITQENTTEFACNLEECPTTGKILL